jgi:tRNA modification GTPase
MESADLVLAVMDSSVTPTQEDAAVLELAATHPNWILVSSKNDLPSAPVPFLQFGENQYPPTAMVSLSAHTGAGLDQLEAAVSALFPAGDPKESGSLLTDQRQEEAARRASIAIGRASEAMAAGLTPDAILTDVEEALDALGELTGRSAKEEIVSRIFSRFCVGK